jgi:DNA polymerase-3 subunit epsilon
VKFVALDVETANPNMASICQIGIVRFEEGAAVETWSSLVDPKDWFDDMNVSIHGIEEKDVRGAPDFKQVSSEIHRLVAGQVVAIHTAFDRNAISQASSLHGVKPPECSWLNTASVARRAWPEVAQRGYGLAPLAEKLGIKFEHHDAAEDARAAGMILVCAMAEMNLDLEGWMERVRRPINLGQTSSVAHDGNPEGPLFGEVVVFTGALIIPRHEAAELVAKAGCETTDGVTKHTTLLVVGDQDIRMLNGHEKSSKHRKAEELIAKGKPIRILTETDFLSMVAQR